MSLAVIHNKKSGMNSVVGQILADTLSADRFAAEDNPSLDEYEIVILVLSNAGDEELPQPMEDYLCSLQPGNKTYAVCELGNYFGLDHYCGCKMVAFQILDGLGWNRVSDLSLDSTPDLDDESLKAWIKNLKIIIDHSRYATCDFSCNELEPTSF